MKNNIHNYETAPVIDEWKYCTIIFFFFASSTQEISNLKCQSFFSFFKHMFKTHSNEHNQFDMITRRYKTKEVLSSSKIQNILASELIHCIKRFHIRSCNFEIMKLTLQKLFKKTQQICCKMHPILLTENKMEQEMRAYPVFNLKQRKLP